MKKIIGEQTLCEGRFSQFKNLKLEGGGNWEFISRSKAINAVAGLLFHPENDTLILIEQFRYPIKAKVLELVAGICDKNLSLEEILKEEIQEEAGFQDVRNIKLLSKLPSSQGITDEIIHLFSAEVYGKRGKQKLEDLEDIRVFEVLQRDVDKFIISKQKEGILIDGKIWTGLYLARINEILK